MGTLDEAVKATKDHSAGKQDILRSWLAFLGNGQGTIDGPQANFSYVRYPLLSSPPVEMYNVKCGAGYDGMRVRVGYTSDQPTLLQVLTQDDPRFEYLGTNSDGSGGQIGQFIQKHAQQHAWLNTDPVFIDYNQITNLAVYAAGGMLIGVRHGIIPRVGIDTYVTDQTLDLTSYVPVSGALWALISISSGDGTPAITLGSSVTDRSTLNYTAIPDTPVGNFRLAAVALYAGQTAVVMTRTQQDIFDLRWPQEFTASSPVMYEHVTNTDSITLLIGMVVYMNAANSARAAKADDYATVLVAGLMTSTVASGSAGEMQLNGQLTALTTEWDVVTGGTGGLDPGQYYYLSPSVVGGITTIAPSAPGQFCVKVGLALSTTTMLIDIDPSNNVITGGGGGNTTLDNVVTIGTGSSNYTSIATAVATANLARLLLVTPGTYTGAVDHNRSSMLNLASLQQYGQLEVLSYASGVALTLSSGSAYIHNLSINGGNGSDPAVAATSTGAGTFIQFIRCNIQTAATKAFSNVGSNYYWTWFNSCYITGDIEVLETVYLTECIVYGNVTIYAADTHAGNDPETGTPIAEIRGGKIIGDLSIAAGITVLMKNMPQITGTITIGTGATILGPWQDVNGNLVSTGTALAVRGTLQLNVIQTAISGAAAQLGFFGEAPIVQQALASYTPATESTPYSGIDNAQPDTPYAQVDDLNALRAAYENLRLAVEDLRTKLQDTTLVD